ncbi:MAG: histidinol-phosphatase [Hyphomicrobiales bacterium]
MDEFLRFAHGLAGLSAAAILPHFRRTAAVDDKAGKGQFDPVTIADRAAEQAIRSEVSKVCPDHGFVGEEFGDQGADADYRWIVDPIDGTRSFITGIPIWGTLIGLERGEDVLLGMMDQPFTRERFWGAAGKAAYRGPDGEHALAVRACPELAKATLATTSPDMFATGADLAAFEALSKTVRMRRFGGDCYLYCMLASGQIDLVVESGLKPYDIAPLIPIIEGAGGIVSGWDGGTARKGGQVIAAGDRRAYEAALKVLNG